MFLHYLKIAFRNLWKYKSQSIISIAGLAVGFVCFALATLWIRYEMTFDSFHKNAKQMYVVYIPSNIRNQTGYDRQYTPVPLAAYLKETFPEIADVTIIRPAYYGSTVTAEGIKLPASIIYTDSSFFRMFDIKIIEGDRNFLLSGNQKLAITWKKARQLFGNKNPIGKTVNNGFNDFTICAVISGMAKQSNYPFDFIGLFTNPSQNWKTGSVNTIIELFPGTNIETFEKKLYDINTGEERCNISKMTIKPLTKMRYTDPDIKREIKLQHILIFAISGLLVVLCSLFNYLTLFGSRFRIRQKELALRVVCGASGRSLLTMLSIEFILTLLFALVLGSMLMQLVHKPFLALSNIQMDLSAIYCESVVYVGGVILISLLVFWLILFIFRRRSLNLSIRLSNKNLSRKISIIVQLIISIGFAFCTIVILKQIYSLHNSDEIGFSFKNRGSLIIYSENSEIISNQLKQLPEITEVVDASGLSNILPQSGREDQVVSFWDDKPANVENISLEKMLISPDFTTFYDFRLLAGEMLTDADPDSFVLINENAVKAFGWHNPVGKQFDNKYTVKGVIKHVCNFAPTVQAKPVFYLNPPPSERQILLMYTKTDILKGGLVLIKYHDGMWKSCKEKILKMKNEQNIISEIYNSEEIYKKYLKSENALIKLLSFVSTICVLICVFGFVSLVSLTCEERRKAIAIRKINGATVGDILSIFSKEYFLLLIIGAAIAFPAGYLIMQRWLEQYVKQTAIPAWIYLSIICVLALIIVLCVGWRVYKASVENPAEVVKTE